MIKKYAAVKHLIQRNKICESTERINFPFVIIGRGASKGGYIKLETTKNDKKASVMSQINLKMHGDLQSLLMFKACRDIPDTQYNGYIKEVIDKIGQKFNNIPAYLKYHIPK